MFEGLFKLFDLFFFFTEVLLAFFFKLVQLHLVGRLRFLKGSNTLIQVMKLLNMLIGFLGSSG